jgi:hypothetical protein
VSLDSQLLQISRGHFSIWRGIFVTWQRVLGLGRGISNSPDQTLLVILHLAKYLGEKGLVITIDDQSGRSLLKD